MSRVDPTAPGPNHPYCVTALQQCGPPVCASSAAGRGTYPLVRSPSTLSSYESGVVLPESPTGRSRFTEYAAELCTSAGGIIGGWGKVSSWSHGASAAGMAAVSSGMSWIAGASSIFGGITGALGLAQGWGERQPIGGAVHGAEAGAAVGSCFPGIGTAVGAAVGAIVGALTGMIRSGKHEHQKVRDHVRDVLQAEGILNEKFQLKLAGGAVYDIGTDGGPREEFGGLRPFEVDFNRPFAAQAVTWADGIVSAFAQGNEKAQSDFAGYFANAAMSNATTLEGIREYANDLPVIRKVVARVSIGERSECSPTSPSHRRGKMEYQERYAQILHAKRLSNHFQGDPSGAGQGHGI
jgi:hypothetical protein